MCRIYHTSRMGSHGVSPSCTFESDKISGPSCLQPKEMGGVLSIFIIFFPKLSIFFRARYFKEIQNVMYLASLASNINKNSSNLDSSLSSLFFYNLVTQKEMTYREWNRVVLPNILWLLVEA